MIEYLKLAEKIQEVLIEWHKENGSVEELTLALFLSWLYKKYAEVIDKI